MHFNKLTPYKDNSTCSQESQLRLWQPLLFVLVANIRKTHAVFYLVNSMKLKSHDVFQSLGNQRKLQVSSCRCLLRQKRPTRQIFGGHLLSNCTNPTMAHSRSDTGPAIIVCESSNLINAHFTSLQDFMLKLDHIT